MGSVFSSETAEIKVEEALQSKEINTKKEEVKVVEETKKEDVKKEKDFKFKEQMYLVSIDNSIFYVFDDKEEAVKYTLKYANKYTSQLGYDLYQIIGKHPCKEICYCEILEDIDDTGDNLLFNIMYMNNLHFISYKSLVSSVSIKMVNRIKFE
jgi:hypothetical protein